MPEENNRELPVTEEVEAPGRMQSLLYFLLAEPARAVATPREINIPPET